MTKTSLKDKLDDDELDLSLMQLTDIPVTEMATLGKKLFKLNISHNLLTMVPSSLPQITHLVALDLSKNQISDLPENFGLLVKLRALDLYSNQIEKLPLSFAQLKSLRWLDLKENPLVPELAKAAGPCITKVDCEQAAKRVVARLQSIESQLIQEEKRRMEAEEQIRRQKEKVEEAERERLRAEKKLAKEKRREKDRLNSVDHKDQFEGDMNNVQINGNKSNKRSPMKNGRMHISDSSTSTAGFSCFGFLLKLMMFLSISIIATGVLLLWLYTDGKMDSDSIQRAVPIIQKDVESQLMSLGKRSERFYKDTEKMTRPYIKNTVQKFGELSKEAGVKAQQSMDWVEANYGDTLRNASSKARHYTSEAWILIRLWALEAWKFLSHLALIFWAKCVELYKDLIPTLARYWEQMEPTFVQVGQKVTSTVLELHSAIQQNFPVYMEWLKVTAEKAFSTVYQYVQELMA